MICLNFLEIDYLRYFSLKGFVTAEAFIYVLQTTKTLRDIKTLLLVFYAFFMKELSLCLIPFS